MKTLFLPFLISLSLISGRIDAQEMTINLTGDANTEQSAKLELIRILQERITKLTVSQLNTRILVSTGVKKYYKVGEIIAMNKEMYGLRSKYTTLASNLEKGNSGFSATTGNGFAWAYMRKYNAAVGKAQDLTDQLSLLLKDGKPIALPPLPTFSITPPASPGDIAGSFASKMQGIMAQYGITSQADIDNLPADKRAAFDAAVDAAKAEFEKTFKDMAKSTTKSSLTLLGNVVGTLVGIPGAGSLIAGLASGDVGAIAGLVGSLVDKFQIPDEYYDSETLKLTDAERLKIIDELHLRMSELYQQVIAMGTSMSNEAKSRYNELSQPRNEAIMFGPKK